MSPGMFRWSCSKCGRPNEVEVAGRNPDSPVNCKWPPCKASKRIPKRLFDGGTSASSGRLAVSPRRRATAAPRQQRRPAASRRLAAAEVEPWQPSPRDLERFAEGFRALRRPDHPVVLEPTVVISPDRTSVVQPAEQVERVPVADRLRQGLSRRLRSAPYVDPLQPQSNMPCIACAHDGRRMASGQWPAAAFAIELPAVAEDLPAGKVVLVCARHLQMVREHGYQLVAAAEKFDRNGGPVVRVRRLEQPKPPRHGEARVRVSPHPRPIPVSATAGAPPVWLVRTDFASLPARAPNPVVEISGDYTGRRVASLSSGAVSQPAPRRAL